MVNYLEGAAQNFRIYLCDDNNDGVMGSQY